MKESRKRLLHQITFYQHESWFRAFIRKLGEARASDDFMALARNRLLYRITALPQPIRVPLRGMALFLNYTKKALASTLVMAIAVTSTLFFVEGQTVVEASENSYLEIVRGSATVKHPDLIIWEDVSDLIEIRAGDIIRVGEGSEAIIHFFDETELRMGEGSELLISHLAVSPAYSRQAIIEVSLHKGDVWVQTLNVDDGHAGLTLSTRDAVAKTLNGTFNVSSRLNEPTIILVLENRLEVTSLLPETRQGLETRKLSSHQKATLHSENGRPVFLTDALSQQDKSNDWVQVNLRRDQENLTELRQKGIERLTLTAGTLPGQMLYPVKQAKERLKLAFSTDSALDLQIEIANRRLNEAVVLFETGEREKGIEALAAYQAMARQIVETQTKGTQKLTNKLVVPHQKVLKAERPNDASTGLVKEALQQTAEILTSDPIELEKIRLANAVERLTDLNSLVEEGLIDVAEKRLSSQQPADSDALLAVENIEDEDLKKQILQEVLELRREELALLTRLSGMLENQADEANTQFSSMVNTAVEVAEVNVEVTLAAALPILPELEEPSTASSADTPQDFEEPVLTPAEIKLAELVDKIMMYNTLQGQQNQIKRLLKAELENPESIDYLISVRNRLQGRIADYLNIRILQLQRKAEFQKHTEMERKIERARKLGDI